MSLPGGTIGILNPREGLAHFQLARHEPASDLLDFVDRHWIVRWDRTGLPPYEQEVLPAPSCHLALRDGASGVRGIGTRRFMARLEGRGRVVGTRFRPGAFVAFTDIPMAALVDRVFPVAEVFGPDGAAVERAVIAEDDDARAVELVTDFLRSRRPRADANLRLAARLVALAQEDRAIAKAPDLARAAGMSVRSLHRLFERYVGLGPKWLIRRSRVQEAAERVASGAPVDWAALAQELGYHDQAHLIHDFKEQVGFTPGAYAERCASKRS